jgi:hypothetical protein
LNDLVRQLPTLIGVIVGALTSYLATSANERSRWRKEQYVRWDERRIAAYAEYSESLKKKAYCYLRIAAGNGLNVRAQPFHDKADQVQSSREIEVERSARWEKILLLGDQAVVSAAQQYGETIFALGDLAETSKIDEHEWLRIVQGMTAARGYFYNAMRHDLEIKSGSLEYDPMLSWVPIGLESSFNRARDSAK